MNLDDVVSLVTDYGLGIQGTVMLFTSGKTFYLLETVQTGPGAHTVSYSVGSAGCIPGRIVARAKSWPLTTV